MRILSSNPSASARRQAVVCCSDASQEFPSLPLDDALALVSLYGRKGDERYERAALRYLEKRILGRPG
jgi:hypothetical protein